MCRAPIAIAALTFAVACGERAPEPPPPPITVFAAASLARPMQELASAFERETRVPVRVELGGSLDHARRISDLGRVPDVLVLVDDEVMASLMPAHLDWYVRFATNRLVVAYGPRSRHGDSITADNWWRILSREDVRVGRADPVVAPAGRHALTLLQRAEQHYAQPGLNRRILARSPAELLRPNAADLAALLEAGEVDYILDYESVARQYGFRFVELPTELALPVLYGVSVPRAATHPDVAQRFVAAMLSGAGLDMLRAAHVDVLPVPVAIGANIPPGVTDVVRTVSAAATAAPAR